ncbi:1,2-phenylacetyl-CoA epoxidase subunit PaaD [Ramlibacter sp. PS3R-8]|uniref:1,2-phenylacetyl-CoA epoxidase subunit PaaD n=1 Tax=Ramlibacter sp. PS3R-8 TaxID=3133437 RepID=UPI0030A50E2B
MTRAQRAWAVLDTVLDPEVPALSVCDLGIVRDVIDHGGELEVVLTPTYSGCPATEMIEENVLEALRAEGLGPARATLRRAPAWTTDWITEDGKRKLQAYGIAPPHTVTPAPAYAGAGSVPGAQGFPLRFFPKAALVSCPRCHSKNTERLSAFGSTACKAMYRCLACREPFEHFKPI